MPAPSLVAASLSPVPAVTAESAFAPEASFAQSLPAIAEALLEGRLERQTFWWTSGSDKIKPCILTYRGLPNSAAFAALLDGNWVRWGWVSAL